MNDGQTNLDEPTGFSKISSSTNTGQQTFFTSTQQKNTADFSGVNTYEKFYNPQNSQMISTQRTVLSTVPTPESLSSGNGDIILSKKKTKKS